MGSKTIRAPALRRKQIKTKNPPPVRMSKKKKTPHTKQGGWNEVKTGGWAKIFTTQGGGWDFR